MGLREVKAKLKTMKKNEIINLIGELYKNNKPVKEQLEYWLQPNEEELHRKYREKIVQAIYPDNVKKPKLREAKQAIADFRKFNPDPIYIADLMFFYVDACASLTADYGDLGFEFISGLQYALRTALKYMVRHDFANVFTERFEKLLLMSSHIGYQFQDSVLAMFYAYIPELLSDEEDENEEEDDDEIIEEKSESETIIIDFPKQ